MPVRKIKASYSSLTGTFISRKMNRAIAWESALERDLYYLLEFDPAVTAYEEQPIIFHEKGKSYTPDCLVTVSEDSEVFPSLAVGKNIIEVKYRQDLFKQWKKLKPKFKMAIKAGRKENFKFKLLTDHEIKGTKLTNIKKIEHHMRHETDKENEIREMLKLEMGSLKLCSINELLSSCLKSRENQISAIPVVWRMIGEKSLGIDLNRNITFDSQVWDIE